MIPKWLVPAIAAASVGVSGWMGAKVISQGEAISAHTAQLDDVKTRLERIENKLDLLIFKQERR